MLTAAAIGFRADDRASERIAEWAMRMRASFGLLFCGLPVIAAYPLSPSAEPLALPARPPQSTAPIAAKPTPARARAEVYAMGVLMETVLRDCVTGATAEQRGALARKIDALRAEIGLLDAQIRASAKAHPLDCPDPETQADFPERLQHFIDKSPEDLVETMSRGDGKP